MSQISSTCTYNSIYDRIPYKSRGAWPHDKGLGKLNTKKRGATGMWSCRSLDSKLIENSDELDIHFKGFMLLSIIVALA